MTYKETAKLIAMLREFYRDDEASDIETKVRAWHAVVGSQPYADMEAAVLIYAAGNNAFFPAPGQLLEILRQRRAEAEPSAEEVWERVVRVTSYEFDRYRPDESFRMLPESAQRVIGGSGTLYSWAEGPESEMARHRRDFIREYNRQRDLRLLEDTTPALPAGSTLPRALPQGRQTEETALRPLR